MNKKNIVLKAILALLLLSCAACKGVYSQDATQAISAGKIDPIIDLNDKEDSINAQFQQIQMELEKGDTAVDTSTKYDEEYESYKSAVFNSIVEKGQYQTQIAQVKQMQTDAKGLVTGKAVSFLELNTKVPIPTTDDPKYFFGSESYTTNCSSLPLSGSSKLTPWSSWWWPTRSGGVSVRYAGGSKSTVGLPWYQSVYKYRQPTEHNSLQYRSSFASYVDAYYSPAEKYDLAMGDKSYTLTNWTKREGGQWSRNGDVPGWYGICHGWCPASYLFGRPSRPVTITAADGKTRVRFLPDDIRALASQFWANADYTTKWVGARCGFYTSNAGWSADPKCRSLNPGSAVVTLANQIGIKGKNLTLDPQADPEIWNQPVKSYSFRYYNVLNSSFSSNANAARVPMTTIKRCGSSWCRKIAYGASSGAAYAVGVVIRVSYAKETNPVHSTVSASDKYQTDSYDGAIELDANGNIIGGVWKTTKYPNFMWTPDESKFAGSVSDAACPTFGGSSAELKNFSSYAVTASKKGQVIKSFIQFLVDKSK